MCSACGLGLLLETRSDMVPGAREAFLVVDATIMVQAMSREAERLLLIEEDLAVNHPVTELLVPADSEAAPGASLGAAIAMAVAHDQPVGAHVRPWNTFGVRMRARIGACGPPRAALIVLEPAARGLRALS